MKSETEVAQSCPTLCDPIDGSPPGSPIPGILQARTLEWAAVSFSNAWKWKVKVKSLSRVSLLATPGTAAHPAPPSVVFSRQEYRSGVPLPSPGYFEYRFSHLYTGKKYLLCLLCRKIEKEIIVYETHWLDPWEGLNKRLTNLIKILLYFYELAKNVYFEVKWLNSLRYWVLLYMIRLF